MPPRQIETVLRPVRIRVLPLKRAAGLDARHRRLLVHRSGGRHVWREGASFGCLQEEVGLSFLLIVRRVGLGGGLNEQEVVLRLRGGLLLEQMLFAGRGLRGQEMLLAGVVILPHQ